MTVMKMLTGKDMPMSNLEFEYTRAYFNRKIELENEAHKAAEGRGKAKSGKLEQKEFKRTMGNKQQ